MSIQQFLKGLLMTIFSAIVVAFNTTPIDVALLIVTIVSAILVYSGKNLISVWQSDSLPGKLSLVNIISGIFIAVGTGLTDYFAQYFIDGSVDWMLLSKLVLSITLTYLGSTLFAPANKESKKFTLSLIKKNAA